MHRPWSILLLVAGLVAPAPGVTAADEKDPLLDALTAEL